jgi:hypothetical protein
VPVVNAEWSRYDGRRAMRSDRLRTAWPYWMTAIALVSCDVDLREGWFNCRTARQCPDGWPIGWALLVEVRRRRLHHEQPIAQA